MPYIITNKNLSFLILEYGEFLIHEEWPDLTGRDQFKLTSLLVRVRPELTGR